MARVWYSRTNWLVMILTIFYHKDKMWDVQMSWLRANLLIYVPLKETSHCFFQKKLVRILKCNLALPFNWHQNMNEFMLVLTFNKLGLSWAKLSHSWGLEMGLDNDVWSLKLRFVTEVWSWWFELKVWSWRYELKVSSLKLKFEVEKWSWILKLGLKFEVVRGWLDWLI